ncbi:MAG: putative integral rane protein [Thermoleophilia bacterium]|nr:putative integral rane protein [Thermoleophilia bacterium]
MGISLHDVILLVHVAAAVAWLGSVLAFEVLAARQRGRGDAAEGVAFALDHAFFTRAVALPGALALLLSGGWLMHDGGFEIRESWWIGAGLGIWFVAFLGSTMLRGPQLARVVRGAAEAGPDDEDVRWRLRQVRMVTRGELLLLTVALAVMVLKPT